MLQLPTIFIGEVIDGGITSIREDPWNSRVNHVRFRVLENFRGLAPNTVTVDVELAPTMGMCAPIPYHSGRRYLVVPDKRDGRLSDGACFQGRDVETAAEDVRQVREYFAGKMQSNVHGRVAVARAPVLVDFLLEGGEAKPLAGVTISTSRGGKTWSTRSSADGRYSLPLPAAGVHSVRARLEPYVPDIAEIYVRGSGCATHDFALTVDNTISGSVLDSQGEPLKEGRVGLIDLDRPPPDTAEHIWFNDAYVDGPDMTFTFKNVPIGRYLLVFNPDGPRWGRLFDGASEISYYPSGSTRAGARTIEIKSGSVHLTGMDLVAGPQVTSRQVTVRVQFPDGTPMKTARIRLVGLPLLPGEPEWVAWGGLVNDKDNGSVQFTAPANRRLRLEVTDMYGRELKQKYTSTHEPGSATITQEFIVTP